MEFIGRKSNLKQLEELYRDRIGRIVTFYGRRRIGKSELIHHFRKNKKNLYFEGLEGEYTQAQINNFTLSLSLQIKQPHLKNTQFKSWGELFSYLTTNVFSEKEKYVLILDEFQWMSSGQTKLINQIKSYWDLHWKKQGVFLILCGSIAHFMVKKVIKSKALYGRIDREFLIEGMRPDEIKQFIPRKSDHEILKYMMIFGGVPKYYDLLIKNRSLEQNINTLMFTAGGFFSNEIEKIFFSQFREHQTYKAIVEKLSKENLSLNEISKKISYSSGGSLKSFLDHLEMASFVRSYTSIDTHSQKTKRYKLADEFLIFYYKFLEMHRQEIKKNISSDLFTRFVKPKWNSSMGFSFELFCLKNQTEIAKRLGFEEKVVKAGPLFSKRDGYQFDLVYYRNDQTISLCEIKFYDGLVDTEVIKQFNTKLERFRPPKGYSVEKIIISQFGITEALSKSEYFDHSFVVTELFRERD